jgi:hypothetical protein
MNSSPMISSSNRDSSLRSRLDRALAAVAILSPQHFGFEGETVPAVPQPGWGNLPAPANPLVAALEQRLYNRFFCRDSVPPAYVPTDPAPFIQRLSQANPGQDRWDRGWRINRVGPAGQVMAEKHGRYVDLWPGQYVVQSGGGPPQPGQPITAYFPRESATLQPGFFFVFSDAPVAWDEAVSIVRFYWNVTAEGAPELLARLAGRLNRFQVPFRFKTLTDPAGYDRFDSAVLFISRRWFHPVADIAAEVHAALDGRIVDGTPLFAKPLARGLGLAEDPGNGESFGMSRCRLLAEGLWSAWSRGVADPSARLAEVEGWFAGHGLSLESPWLNRSSADLYELPS